MRIVTICLTTIVLASLLAAGVRTAGALAQDTKDAKKNPDTKPATDKKETKPPVKKWKMDDFVKDEKVGVEGLVNRNFERGKKLFTEVKCLTCHTFAGAGGFVGPSLSAKGASFGPVDILVSILEPNKIIADAYRQKIVELDDGRIFTGMISETDDTTEITPDLLNADKKIVVKTEKIVDMKDSPVSPMPAGLIDALNRDQILDLIAYVISQDDPEDEMFAPPAKKK